MLDVPEMNLPLTAEGYVTQPAEFDDGGYPERLIPHASVSPALRTRLQEFSSSSVKTTNEISKNAVLKAYES